MTGFGISQAKQFTITGEYIAAEADPAFEAPEMQGIPLEEGNDETSEGPQEDEAIPPNEGDSSIDLDSASVVVTHDVASDIGELDSVELVSGSFRDGNFAVSGQIDEPTEVQIAVDIGSDDPLTTQAMVSPGAEVTFALVEYMDARPPQLVLYGASRRAADSTKKFSISGDFNAIDESVLLGVVSVSGPSWDEDGNQTYTNFGTVMVQDGKFSLEAEIDEPVVVNISFNAGANNYYSGQAVVESNSEISVAPHGATTTLLATASSNADLHVELVESWRTDEYLTAIEAYSSALEKYRAEFDAAQEAADESDADEEASDDVDIAAGDEEAEEEETEPATILALADGIPPAEGCEHVDLDEVKSGIMDVQANGSSPSFEALDNARNAMSKIKDSALEQIAQSATDPMVTLLALELGAFGYFSDNRDQAIRIFDELAPRLDEDMVTRRIKPSRDRLVAAIETEENDKGLVPGQKAPEFTLPNLDGVEVALYDVVEDRDLVLIDFWASWCGPCIATFPHLKRFYSAFNDDGFEIVAISIDSTHEDWAQASEEHELPWMNLGEIVEANGEIANAYGVKFIPKGYLLDSEGCVIQKDLMHEKLQEVLVARYGDDPMLHEAKEEKEQESPPDLGSDEVGG